MNESAALGGQGSSSGTSNWTNPLDALLKLDTKSPVNYGLSAGLFQNNNRQAGPP